MSDEIWQSRFLALAGEVSSWSKDPSTKVGCVVIDQDRRILSVGYNGFPRGVEDDAVRLGDRATKHLMTVHAEANAVAAAARNGVSLQGATAYVTHPSCAQCAALMVQAGVRRIVQAGELRAEWRDSLLAAEAICREAGVDVVSASNASWSRA